MIAQLTGVARAGLCRLLYFDEPGFRPNPPITYGWAASGQTHAIEPQPHRQRVNVLGALDQDHHLIWTTEERPTRQYDVIAFFDRLSQQVGTLPLIVVLDHTGIHRAKAVERCRRRWARHVLELFFLPPYCPELNRIEILLKLAKHFWRRPLGLTGEVPRDEVEALMRGFGSRFTINFA